MHVFLSLLVPHVILLKTKERSIFVGIYRRPGLHTMGQYQQWLKYQEIQKRLSSQAEAVETELKELQCYVNQFELQRSTIPSEPLLDNPIIQALIAHLPSH